MALKTKLSLSGFGLLKGLPERKSMGQHVFEHLKQAIIRGSVPAGNRLVESRIAEDMGVSRTPVREAIHKLEREGLLRKQPRGGFTVLGFTRQDIEETFGIRSVLEGYAAKLAAINHNEEDLVPLEQKIDEYGSYLNQGKLAILPRINTEFHDLLYHLSRSSRLIKMIDDLRNHIYRFRQIILKKEKLARTSHKDHVKMMAYIRKRDPEDVERLVRKHILRGQAAVFEAFDKKGEKECR